MRFVLALLAFASPLPMQDDPAAEKPKAPRIGPEARFDASDRDGDGKVTFEEWKAAAPRNAAAKLFERLDADGDGAVTRDEVVAAREIARRFMGDGEVDSGSMRVERDLVYAERDGADPILTSLDLFAPKEGEGHPIVVMIHGGGWKGGDKRLGASSATKAQFFVARGYVFASINYRLSPEVKHPAHVEDVAAAIAWIHDHAKDYGGDPDLLFVMGHSAGAHLAALVAVDERRLAVHQKPLSIVKGVILLDGAGYDITRSGEWSARIGGGTLKEMYADAFGTEEAGWKDASPVFHLAPDKGIPPSLVFFTGRAEGPRARVIQDFADAWAAAGAASEAIPTDQDHAAVNREFGTTNDPVTDRSIAFLDEIVAKRRASRRN